MIFKETKIKGLYVIELEPKIDERGDFVRTFCKDELAKNGLFFDIVQANQSLTKKKGAIRGMHFQKEPKDEAKIIQCLKGKIYDVAIDLRKGSETYGQWVSQELSEENGKMFFLPKGFAHGFQTLDSNCRVQYSMSELYYPEFASGVRWNDSSLKIKWPVKNPILSERDKNWPLIKN